MTSATRTGEQRPHDRERPAPGRPRLVLHIGAGKTGSSAIQHALAANSARLAGLGVVVLDNHLGMGLHVDGTQAQFFDRLRAVDDRNVDDIGLQLDRAGVELARRGGHTLVASAENLIDSARFARLFVSARGSFDIEVVAYIRRQDELIIAMWNQWNFKTSSNFRTWADGVKGRVGNWDRLIEGWEKILGDVRYTVRVYDRDRLVDGDVVADFLSILNVPSGGFIGLGEQNVNRSLNEVAMRIATRNAAFFTDAHDRRFTDFLRQLGGAQVYEAINTALYWDADERRAVVELYAESNERLRQRHFPELPVGGLFSTDFLERGAAVSDTERIERELDLAWTVMFNAYVAHWPRVSLYLLRRLTTIDRWFDRKRIARRSR